MSNLRPRDELLGSPSPSTSRNDHPLSPSTRPRASRRAVPTSTQPPSYFDSYDPATTPVHRGTDLANGNSLLPAGRSRIRGSTNTASVLGDVQASISTTGGTQPLSATRPWSSFLQSLSKQELAVVETDFDSMSEEDLITFLHSSNPQPAAPEDLSIPPASTVISVPPPTLPAPASLQRDVDQPLFPPSPPLTTRADLVDHPLRILSRAVRELRETVEMLEAENLRLSVPTQGVGVRVKRNRQADQVSIPDLLH
jgi:hypothetical protein